MSFFRKSFSLLNKLTPVKTEYLAGLITIFSLLIGFFTTVDSDLVGAIGTFIALFSGILFSFTFLMFEASKKKKQELIEIFDELGITYKSFQKDSNLPENDKFNQSDIFNRLRYIEFADTLFTLITLLVVFSIFVFICGISLGINIQYLYFEKYQSTLNKIGLSVYSLATCLYIWVVAVLVIKVYRFYMYELKL